MEKGDELAAFVRQATDAIVDALGEITPQQAVHQLLEQVAAQMDPGDPESVALADALGELLSLIGGSLSEKPNGTMAQTVIWLAREARRKRTTLIAEAFEGEDKLIRFLRNHPKQEQARAVHLERFATISEFMWKLDRQSVRISPENMLNEMSRAGVRLETRIGNIARKANFLGCGKMKSADASKLFRNALKAAGKASK